NGKSVAFFVAKGLLSQTHFFFKVFSWGICTINTKRAKRTRTLFFLLDKLVLFEKVILFCLFVSAPFLW
ncbi:hypothetical protein, partial [Streptococcus constellatus]|uniref:hypothetical protein n=1 Tax=Streptococcus constellatus TaxID=76860 RepID=UPI00241E69BD